jgi:hypothetical protein
MSQPLELPVTNIILRNPHHAIPDHPTFGVKAITIEKVEDQQENDAILQLIEESNIDTETEDVYLSTMIGSDNRGYSNVISPEQRYITIENFIRRGWKLEEL